jgi:prepilin peptidase CpaA
MHHVIWIFAVILAVSAGWLDWRSRRIPNWLTVSGFLIGLALNTAVWGWQGAQTALAGAALPLVVLLPVVLLRGLGAGDWKLMGALGGVLGWKQIFLVLLVTIFVAGAIAVGQMIHQRRVRKTLANLWELVRGFFIFGLRPHPELSLENPAAMTFPFGVAVAAATLLCYGVAAVGL